MIEVLSFWKYTYNSPETLYLVQKKRHRGYEGGIESYFIVLYFFLFERSDWMFTK